MTQEQKKEIKSVILKELKKLKTDISNLQEMSKPISPECALGDLARFELMNDQEVYKKSLKEALIRQNRLEYALRKIDTKEYGLCVECDEEIAYERLLLLPESALCTECIVTI
jgi:DnaK suppressor protein